MSNTINPESELGKVIKFYVNSNKEIERDREEIEKMCAEDGKHVCEKSYACVVISDFIKWCYEKFGGFMLGTPETVKKMIEGKGSFHKISEEESTPQWRQNLN